jgi:hypothetical protein
MITNLTTFLNFGEAFLQFATAAVTLVALVWLQQRRGRR